MVRSAPTLGSAPGFVRLCVNDCVWRIALRHCNEVTDGRCIVPDHGEQRTAHRPIGVDVDVEVVTYHTHPTQRAGVGETAIDRDAGQCDRETAQIAPRCSTAGDRGAV